MKRYFTLLLCCTLFYLSNAQDIAPDFTLTDIDGNTHNLYDYLDEGKVVVLDFYAVWCAPCQDNAPGVESVWQNYGPDGSDQIVIIGMEGDDNSTDQQVFDYAVEYDCNNPQINDTGNANDLYNIEFYPTYFVVCPDRSMETYSGDPDEIADALVGGIEFCAPYLDLQVDARIFDYNSGTTLCSEETTPNITLMNMGQDNLSSVDINVSLNGDLQSTTNWTGDLSLFEYENVSLPSINLSGVSNPELTIVLENPNGVVDPNPENDTKTVSLQTGGTTYETTGIQFELAFDNFPQETSWEFLNSIGEVMASGDGYVGWPDFSPPIDTFLPLVSGECYTFNIYDDIGDGICCDYADPGEGFWKITATDTNELIAEGGTFTFQESALFGLALILNTTDVEENKLSIYPNPAANETVIEASSDNYNWEIISLDGRVCQNGKTTGSHLTKINLLKLGAKGTYIVKVETEAGVAYEKLVVY